MGLRTTGLKAKDGFCFGRSVGSKKSKKNCLSFTAEKKQGHGIPGVLVNSIVKVKRKGKISLRGRSEM